MSRLNDFTANITLETAAQVAESFGKILIFETDTDHPYETYRNMLEVVADFADTTDTYKTAAKIFAQVPAPAEIAIAGDTTVLPADIVTALNLIINEDWFAVTCTDNADATVTALNSWVADKNKMYIVTTQTKTMTTATLSPNTFVCYHSATDAYLAEAAFTYMIMRDIGSQNLKAKTLVSMPESVITDAELAVIRTNRVVTYIKDDGVLQVTDGFTGGGEYLDTVLAKYWVKFNMESQLRALQRGTAKIPYSNAGIAMLVGVVENVLKTGANNGIVLIDDTGVPVYSYTTIKREDTTAADRSNRVYNGLAWTATIAGAIDKVTINGTLTL